MDAPYNTKARRKDGFILQAVLPDGERRWFLRQDQPFAEALREVCTVLDGIGGKVETISSPVSIWRDLQGTRAQQLAQPHATPEMRALARVGKLDLLA